MKLRILFCVVALLGALSLSACTPPANVEDPYSGMSTEQITDQQTTEPAKPSDTTKYTGYVVRTGTAGGASVGGNSIGARTDQSDTTNNAATKPQPPSDPEDHVYLEAIWILICIGLIFGILWWIVTGKRFYLKEPWVIA